MTGPDLYANPEPYYAPGWQPAAPPVDPVSVASLVTGVLGLGPVALGLGIGGLARTRATATTPRRGRGFALAGVVLGSLGTLALLVGGGLLVATALASRPLPADVSAPVDAHAVQLVTGNCLAELPADGPVDTVRVVPCDDEHVARVVSQYAFDEDAVWPGQQAADQRVAAGCVLSADETQAGDRLVTWAPTEESWGQGDRTGLCLVVAS